MVIDDNPAILFAVKQTLGHKGYSVHSLEKFTGVSEVLAWMPDLIYLDISLDGQNGRDIAWEIKSDERTKHIPIIILTAYANAEQLAKQAGADGFLSKPFELDQLWATTTNFLNKSDSFKV